MSQASRGEGFATILGAVTLIGHSKKTFRTVDIVDATGISRQLTHYHLKRMAERGFFAHYGNGVYGDINLGMLSEELTLMAESNQSNRPRQTKLISYRDAAMLNAKIDFYQALHQYQFLPDGNNSGETWDASEIRRSIINDINASIAMLKSTKKYVSSLRTLSTKYRYGRLTFKRKAVNKLWDETGEVKLRDWRAVEFFERYMKMILDSSETVSDNPDDAWDDFIADITKRLELDKTRGDSTEWAASGDYEGA